MSTPLEVSRLAFGKQWSKRQRRLRFTVNLKRGNSDKLLTGSIATKKQKHIVVIGGGAGTSVILEGLKKYPLRLSAIVNTFDNGGSSGWLRKQLGVLPPGDLRQCLRALSNSKIWRELLEYRFKKGLLKGQNLGNFLISAAEDLDYSSPSDFKNKVLPNLLSVKGEVAPVSLENSHLHALLKNGKVLKREDKITASKIISEIGVARLYLKPEVQANPKALRAINQAGIIVIAAGNLYSSVLPNFLVERIKETIRESRAKKIYVCNLTAFRGHTDNWFVEDYFKEIENYLGKGIIETVIYNNQKPAQEIVELCGKKHIQFVMRMPAGKIKESQINKIKFYGYPLISNTIYKPKKEDKIKRSIFRHDPEKLAKAILEVSNLSFNL